MIRLIDILLPSILLLTACRHVSVHVVPEDADITVKKQTWHQPADIRVHPFLPVTASISAKGCVTQEAIISYSTPSPLNIVLRKQFKADSMPPGADVFLDGSHIGKTPVAFDLPADQKEAKISFRKNNFIQQNNISFSPAKSDQTIFAQLMSEEAGLLNWSVKPSKYGRAQLVAATVRIERSFQEPGNTQPVSIVQLEDKQRQILSYELLPEGRGILASVLVQTQDEPARYEAQLVVFPMQPDQTQTVLTQGNIDVTPAIIPIPKSKTRSENTEKSDNPPPAVIEQPSVLFASNRTGRLDLWKCRLLSGKATPQKMALVHSSELIMMEPKIHPQGGNVLVTVFQPEKLTAPQIWSFNLNSSKSILPEFFCNGECPAWAPGGRRIAFQKGSPPAIWKIESDGSLMKPLSPANSPAAFKQPAWSPDGKRIAFAANINAPQSQDDTDIWIMDADGGKMTQITFSQALDDMPVWAPDGLSIFFRSNRNRQWGIWNIQVP